MACQNQPVFSPPAGHSDSQSRNVPTLVKDISGVGQVACGSSHTIAVAQDGRTVWSFGGGDNGMVMLLKLFFFIVSEQSSVQCLLSSVTHSCRQTWPRRHQSRVSPQDHRVPAWIHHQESVCWQPVISGPHLCRAGEMKQFE